MRAIKKKTKLRLSSFIIDDMAKFLNEESKTLHYGMLLTKVFEYFKVDLDEEVWEFDGPRSQINTGLIRKMGYTLDEDNNWMNKGEEAQKKKKEGAGSSAPVSTLPVSKKIPIPEQEEEEKSDKGIEKVLAYLEKIEKKIDDYQEKNSKELESLAEEVASISSTIDKYLLRPQTSPKSPSILETSSSDDVNDDDADD